MPGQWISFFPVRHPQMYAESAVGHSILFHSVARAANTDRSNFNRLLKTDSFAIAGRLLSRQPACIRIRAPIGLTFLIHARRSKRVAKERRDQAGARLKVLFLFE
jgi:hypothetical protein